MLLILSTLFASVLSFEHREKSHNLFNDLLVVVVVLVLLSFSFVDTDLLPLNDLLENSNMLFTPMRLPSVMLLSWKKEPVDSVSKSDEKSVEEEGEPVSVVLKDIDPE